MTGNRRRTVFILDDDRDVCEATAAVLEHLGGYQVTCEFSGDVALARLRRGFRPDLPLDYLMPGMTGDQLLRACRADKDLARIPAVFVTGVDSHLAREVFKKLGEHGVQVLRKPLDADRLIGFVNAVRGARP